MIDFGRKSGLPRYVHAIGRIRSVNSGRDGLGRKLLISTIKFPMGVFAILAFWVGAFGEGT